MTDEERKPTPYVFGKGMLEVQGPDGVWVAFDLGGQSFTSVVIYSPPGQYEIDEADWGEGWTIQDTITGTGRLHGSAEQIEAFMRVLSNVPEPRMINIPPERAPQPWERGKDWQRGRYRRNGRKKS